MRGRQTGYTLIEVIVAFALLAVALTLLLGTLSGGARQMRQSDDATRAALHAQSLLADVGVGVPLDPGDRDGQFEDGRFRWRLHVAPYTDPALPPDPNGLASPAAARLLALTLTVEWGDTPGERLQWASLRLVPAEGPG